MDNYLSLFCVGISLRICGNTDSKLESKVLNINATTLPAGDKYIILCYIDTADFKYMKSKWSSVDGLRKFEFSKFI